MKNTGTDRPSPASLGGIIGIAGAYFVLARLSLLLAIPPGYASAIWPPAGLALATALLYGYRVAFGVFLGSFAANLLTGLNTGSDLLSHATVLSAVIGSGAALQTLIGAFLLSRFTSYPFTLDRGRDVVVFLLLCGPVSCLVNATLSVTCLRISGFISSNEYLFSWLTWWVGDAIGTMIVAPVVLSLLVKNEGIWKFRRITVTLPLCLLFSLIVFIYVLVSHQEQQRIENEFKLKAELITSQIKSEWADHLDALFSQAAFFLASGKVHRNNFKIFTQYWLARHQSIHALEWIPRVVQAERVRYEEAARQDGYPRFRITERAEQGRMIERTAQPEYFPVYYVEPYEGNEMALGFDLASDTSRLNAINQAIETKKPVGTERVILVQEKADQYGFLVFLPVYTPAASRPEEGNQNESFIGFALGVFRIKDVMDIWGGQAQAQGINIRLIDLTAGDQLLYDSVSTVPQGPTVNKDPNLSSGRSWLINNLDIAQRHWQLSFSPTGGYLATHRSLQAWSVLVGGLVFAVFAIVFLLIMTGRTARIETLVREKTRALEKEIAERRQTENALRESEQNYREIFNATSDGLTIHDNSGKIFDVNDRACAIFGHNRAVMLGRSINDLSLGMPPFSKAEAKEKILRTLEEGAQLFEWLCRRENDQLFWAEIAVRACELGGKKCLIASVRDISERKQAEETMKTALKEKEILLREIHHRVKNNMQMISSLLTLQAEAVENEQIRQTFIECQQRIITMAMIHETLYSGNDLSSINLSDYLKRLISHLRGIFSRHTGVQIITELDAIELNIDTAVPCGLIINELLTNAFKHAFLQGDSGLIKIKNHPVGKKELVLEISDNGRGLPADLDFDNPSSLGLKLVKGLLEHQLNGSWNIIDEGGTTFILRWPLPFQKRGETL
ncbi:MAG: CHASE domain-containing protein [Desulfocapsaceae bacterium]|nr:CHASE domain-containing protein [Desulfocapsaceae bacterium]